MSSLRVIAVCSLDIPTICETKDEYVQCNGNEAV